MGCAARYADLNYIAYAAGILRASGGSSHAFVRSVGVWV